MHALYRRSMLETIWSKTLIWNHGALKRSTSFIDIIDFIFADNKDLELFTSVMEYVESLKQPLTRQANYPT